MSTSSSYNEEDDCSLIIVAESPNTSVIIRSITSDDDYESSQNDSLLAASIIRFRTSLHRNETTFTSLSTPETSEPFSTSNEGDGNTESSGLRDSMTSQDGRPTVCRPAITSSSVESNELQAGSESDICEKQIMISNHQYLPSELINATSRDESTHNVSTKDTSQVTEDTSQDSIDSALDPPPLNRYTAMSLLTDEQMNQNENDSEQYSQPITAFRVPAEDDLIQAVPVLNDDSARKQSFLTVNRTRFMIIVLLILLLTTAIIAATVGGICGSGVISCSASSKSSTPIKTTMNDRADSIYTYFNNVTFKDDSSSNLSVYSTQAMDWIVNSDPLQLNVQNNTFRIRQRYALLAVWFHTTVDGDWFNANGWLVDDDECTWYGILCTNIDYGPDVGEQNTVTILNISMNNLIGMIPPDLGLLSKLRRLHLNTNSLSNTIPASIGQLTDLDRIELQFNNISGTLPESFVKLNKLTYISLSYNKLTGPLPTNLGNLSDIYYFTADSNQFTSMLPSSLGLWTNLNTIDFTFNNLVGSLPDEIENWRKIEFILLLDNELTGTLPSGIFYLTNIIGFDVTNNHFVGTIPEGIINWKNIHFLYFPGNNFTGSVPSGICSTNVSTLAADCKVECQCCTYCD
jgi:Leucine-rich repeat (LRR) protein